MRRILFATKNRGKLVELERMLAGIDVVSADALGLPDVIEDGDTFEANAIKKARELGALSRLLTVGDDSGLEVDALDGAPGVLSARYSGAGAEANVRKLLAALERVPDHERTARFRCVIALYDPISDRLELAHGTCEGAIARAPRGTLGFGYDPVFVPSSESARGRTMAELDDHEKDAISHRGVALRALHDRLRDRLGAPSDDLH